MTRSLRLIADRYPLILLLLCSGPLFAADSDEALIEGLEVAETSREKHDILDEIQSRTTAGPLSVELTDRLVAELMSEETYGYHTIMRELPDLAGEQGFSEQSLIYLAEGLSGELTRQFDPATAISKILSSAHSSKGLPEEAFSALIMALDHIAMLNRSAAIEVLAATGDEDTRHSIAMEAVLHALNTNEHQHTRSSAIGGLDRLTGKQAMPPNVLAGVLQSATTDSYMTVRMDALELLANRDIDAVLRETVSTSLAAEIVTPTYELWKRSSGLGTHKGLGDRATAVLAALHEPPFPDHVISAWIAQTRGHLPEKSLEALKRVYDREELSAEQIAELIQIAEGHRQPVNREVIYRMLFVELQAGTLMDALIGFERADDEASRVRAGYAIKEQYRGKEVPDRVADVAARVSVSGTNTELRAIAAGLLSHTRRDREHRESQLIGALERHPEDYDIHRSIIAFYGTDNLDELVTRYAADTDLSLSFRTAIIRELGEQTVTEPGLSAAAEDTLKDVARNAADYYLIQAAGNTLDVWGIHPPLRVAFTKRENQSMALFAVLIAIALLNLIAGLIALINLFKLPLRTEDEGKRTAIRTGMVIGWLVLSLGMTVLLGAGLIGFLGHNSAPKPGDTMIWNTPAYVGTVIYVLLAWLLRRRVRTAAAPGTK